MNLNMIWSALIEGFAPLGFPEMEKKADELGLEPGWLTWVWAIGLFGNEPFSTKSYMRIRPYGSAHVNEARFAFAAEQGRLSRTSENEYVTTEKGRTLFSQILQAADDSIAPLQPISSTDLQKTLDHAKRLVEAALATPEPPSQYGITHYYKNLHPERDTALLRLILHYVAALDQYRGAAHLASWQDYNIEGYAWSLLTSIWRAEADTLETLHNELGASVFAQEEISLALHDLVTRGWIVENAGVYRMTDEGKRIREEAEALTDKYFFAPWSSLNESELEELASLASQLRDGLKA